MKTLTVVGIVLIVGGALMLVFQGIPYTTHEKVIDIGPIEARTATRKTLELPPLLGGLVLVAGVALVILGARSRSKL